MTPAEFKQARRSLGLTQTQLAEILSMTQGHISRCETGRESISTPVALSVRAMALLGTPDTWADQERTLTLDDLTEAVKAVE